MKVKRKWAALLGAVVMAASCAMLSDGNVVKAASAPVVSSSAANATGNIGDTIVVPITFSSESENLSAIHGEPSFDTSVLKYEGVDYVGLPGGMTSEAGGNFGYVTSGNFSNGTINVKFKVLKCTPDPVTVTINNLYYSSHDYLDSDAAVVSANVTVNHPADQNQVEETKATCTDPGHKKVTCGVCGKVLSDEDTPALGHDGGTWKVVKKATCKEKGEKVYTCKVCGDTKTEAIAVKEHEWVVSDDTDKDGWKVVTKATTSKEGSKERVCSICGEKETAVIAKLSADPAKPGNNNTTNKTNTKPSTVKTGDTLNVVYLVLILAAAGGVAVFAAGRRKKNK